MSSTNTSCYSSHSIHLIKSNFKLNFSFIRLIFTTICHNRLIGRFIVVASSVLLILFYIDLYLFVTIMFCVSAASSTGQVLLRPFFMWLCGQRSRQELIELPWIGSVSTLDGLCTGNARPPHLFPSRITTPTIALPSSLRPHLCPRPPAEGTGVFLSVTWFLVRETADWAFVLQVSIVQMLELYMKTMRRATRQRTHACMHFYFKQS